MPKENKEQKYKVPATLNADITCPVPQKLILDPFLFNANFCNMFCEICKCDKAIYAYDNTPHTSDSDSYAVLSKLENCTDSLFTWFKEHMKPTGEMLHLLSVY